MRISDWSSDVCSSYLFGLCRGRSVALALERDILVEPQSIDRLREGEAGSLQGALGRVQSEAAAFQKVGLCLIDPAEEAQDDVGIAHVLNDSGRGRRIQHEIQGADCPETDGHAIDRKSKRLNS